MAEPASRKTLYADPSQTRFYLIPNDAALPEGDLVLRSLTGTKLEVAAAAADPFLITEEQAKELTREVIAKATKTASSFLAGLGGMLQEASRRVDAGIRPEPGPREPAVAEALGVTEEQLRDDPDAVMEGLKRVGQGLQQTLEDAVETGKAADQATRERIRKVADMLGANVDEAEDSVEELLEKMREWLANPELEQKVRDATQRLRDLTDELRTQRGAAPETDEGEEGEE